MHVSIRGTTPSNGIDHRDACAFDVSTFYLEILRWKVTDCTTVVPQLDTTSTDVKYPYDMLNSVYPQCSSFTAFRQVYPSVWGFIRHYSHTLHTLHIGNIRFSGVPVTFLTNLDRWECCRNRNGIFPPSFRTYTMVYHQPDFYNSSWQLPHCHRANHYLSN